MEKAIEAYVASLAAAGGAAFYDPQQGPRPSGKLLFNQYRDDTPEFDKEGGAAARRSNQQLYLSRLLPKKPRLLLCLEAAGYQGCRFSGIAATSERILADPNNPYGPLEGGGYATSSLRPDLWKEPTATIVWDAFRDLGLLWDAVLTNAVPWHPFEAGNFLSNRTPVRSEILLGKPLLVELLSLVKPRIVVAVGNQADRALSELSIEHEKVRHPSYGGKDEFRQGLTAIRASI